MPDDDAEGPTAEYPPDGRPDRDTPTVAVGEELEEAVHWVDRELREARRALWDGKTGKAFASIEAAQDAFETIEEAIGE